MIKSVFTTLFVMGIFFFGMNYAITHPRTSREIMASFGCDYTPGTQPSTTHSK
jgi:hypothetical protein